MKEDIETSMKNERMKLEEQLNAYTATLGNKSKSIGAGALIVGGILVVGYIVGRRFLFPGKKSKLISSDPSTHLMLRTPKHESAIVRMIKEQMTMFLIAIIKERLTAYIN
ncbi:MAG TPA: hypothetical protein VNW99_04540, partial [Cytophagaceae bacterium]|nr:hypothetical protein [Cytophagaceae bacterium]